MVKPAKTGKEKEKMEAPAKVSASIRELLGTTDGNRKEKEALEKDLERIREVKDSVKGCTRT